MGWVIGVGVAIVVVLVVRSARSGAAANAYETPDDDDDAPPLSIVVLMTELPFIDIDVLARAMTTGFGVDFDSAEPPDPDEEPSELELRFADGDNFAMETPMGSYMVRIEGHMHGVIAHDEPYFEDVEAAIESVADLRGKQKLSEHTCWIAVDHVGDPPEQDELRETYARIGRLLLELVDPTLASAVLLPRAQRFYPWRDDMVEALQSGDVLGELSDAAHVPVTPVSADSPEMKAAVAEAKERWPEFLEAFETQNGEAFGIKFLLSGDDDDDFEFPWMEVTKIHGEIIQGKLANEPISRDDLHEGDVVTTRLEDLNDWLYIDSDGEQQGGFTIPVLMREMGGDDE